MSTSTLPSPDCSSRATVGSVVMPASIAPWCSAAMNVLPAPALTVVYSDVLTPALTASAWVRKSVDEPGLVTPRCLPLKSDGEEIVLLLETTSTSPGALENWTTLSRHLPLV